MPLTVLVPWRPQPSRIAAFEALTAWYARHVPDAVMRTTDTDDEIFNLSACRNRAIESVDDENEVVIINDADTVPQLEPLLAAIDAASTSGLVHLPYDRYHWLGASGTAQFLAGAEPEVCDYELVIGARSGVYVTTPKTWWSHGGQDERFRGWGYEDAAWYVAHETLLGEAPRRHAGAVYALHHETQLREGEQYARNAALMQRYTECSVSRDAMAQLVFGEKAS